MAFNDANSARALYDNGLPQAGKTISHDPGDQKVAGVLPDNEEIFFGRVVAPFTLDANNNRVYTNIDDADTAAGGVACFSDDAIAGAASGKYSEFEAITVKERGPIVMETMVALVTTDTLSVFNGDGSESENIGKLAKASTAGYSAVTGLKIIKVLSSSLVEVQITGPIGLTPAS
jgi:hypothetical protein